MRTLRNGLLFFLALRWCPAVLANPQLAVYYSSTIPVKERESVIKDFLKIDEVLVLARSKDFLQILDDSKVPVIIAPAAFEMIGKDYTPVLQFTVSGKAEFHYKILASKKEFKAAQLASSTIGVIEEVNRHTMKDFVNNKIGIKSLKIKTVTKGEDLFPLLIFNAADVILVSPDELAGLKQKFTAEVFEISAVTAAVPYPRVYIKSGEKPTELIEKLKGLDKKVLKKLGLEGIEKIQN